MFIQPTAEILNIGNEALVENFLRSTVIQKNIFTLRKLFIPLVETTTTNPVLKQTKQRLKSATTTPLRR